MAKIIRQYQSEIYGNYRLAYLYYGILTGVLLALTVFFQRLLFPSTLSSPESYVTDGVLAVSIFLAAWHYRSRLPHQKVMLKELLLVGIGMSMVASLLYGLLLWFLCGVAFPDIVQSFIMHRLSVMPSPEESPDAFVAVARTKDYTAGDWAFIGGFRVFVISIIFVFFAAIIFKTEKSPQKTIK
ncbi:MAG: DUF4199 family protein [Bacteroidales bacterium]|nr:DUF4199 family protein [Bacteroidales bacterium]